MLKKLQLKNKTTIIGLFVLLFMLTSLITIPLVVEGKHNNNISILDLNDEDDTETTTEGEDDDDEDGIDDSDEDENERSVEIEVSGTEAQISSEFEDGENDNSFQVALHAESDKLGLEFSFDSETETSGGETEIELEYEIEFTQLVGYNDTDGNFIYDPVNDTTVETYNIGNFNDIDYEFQNTTAGELHILSVMSTDGKFGIVVYVSNEFITVNDTVLTPTQIKFDILINNFTGDFTRVALKTELEFEGEAEYDEDTEDEEYDFADNESEIELSFNDFKGFFSWSQVATTDGIEHDVYNTPFDPIDVDQYIYLNYVAGDEIIHDPKIGVTNVLTIGLPTGINFGLFFPELSKSGFLVLTATAALVSLSLVFIALRRRK